VIRRTGTAGIRFERDGIWIVDDDGLLWEYDPAVPGSALWAEFGFPHEGDEIKELGARLGPGSIFVDVGANIGSHSITLSNLVKGLRVLALEPSTAAFKTLCRNVAKNEASNVDARELAAMDRSGTVRLTTGLQGENFVVPDKRTIASETVECRTLDDLLRQETASVDVIKCDVEGAELSVFRGAERTLERHAPALLIEAESRHARRYGQTGAEIFEFLTTFGYTHRPMVDGRPRESTGSIEQDLALTRNFLFEKMTT
jgi:FkbM family methyltransferase